MTNCDHMCRNYGPNEHSKLCRETQAQAWKIDPSAWSNNSNFEFMSDEDVQKIAARREASLDKARALLAQDETPETKIA